MIRLLFKSRYFLMQAEPKNPYKFYDIAANLTDNQFGGHYYDKKHHEDDRNQVIKRARQYGNTHLLIAAGNIQDAQQSFQLCSKHQNCFATIGVHPCRAKQPFAQKWKSVDKYFQDLQEVFLKIKDKVVAIGQCGLDYDRLEWSTKQEQLKVFPYHFALAEKYNLPMYLHNRNTGDDFFKIVKENRKRFRSGVVHSFTGTSEELKQILDMDLYVGINGCSLKTEQNLKVLHEIPLQKMMLETDSPYCDIKKTHAGYSKIKTQFKQTKKEKKKEGHLVRGRNEPCRIIQVLQVVSAQLKIDPAKLAQITYENSIKLLTKQGQKKKQE